MIKIARIIIVDDEKDIVRLFEEVLNWEGHQIIAKASNGEEAIEAFKSAVNPPDIILMDHRMPIKDGLSATEEILSANKNVKIVFVSADFTAREKALKIGATLFLEKPIDFSKLLEAIRKCTASFIQTT